MRNRLSIPELSKASLENSMEGGNVNPHCGDECTVFVIFVEACSWCSDMGLGEQVHPSKVLQAGRRFSTDHA